MYGSYASCRSTPAMDMPSRSTYQASSHADASCAFPSWPRRDSLTSDHAPRASSYISDEDLQFLDAPVFADHEDAHSVSSYGSRTPSPQLAPVRHISDEEIEELRREQAMRQREMIQAVMNEKEMRRQAAKAAKARKTAAAAAKKASAASPASKSKLAAIAEAAE